MLAFKTERQHDTLCGSINLLNLANGTDETLLLHMFVNKQIA